MLSPTWAAFRPTPARSVGTPPRDRSVVLKSALLQARDDLSAFARLIGFPLLSFQSEALSLESKMTILVAPRQTGKSYALSVVALHRAARSRNQRVLVVSAGEEAAKRLLRVVAEMAASSSALQGSVLNETASVLTLTNGSEIRSVPASERQIRGWTVDLLVVDEAAYVTDDVLLSAALPTTVARPDSRIVLASTPWGMQGAFYRFAMQGREEDREHTRTFQWRRLDAPWIDANQVELARATLSPLRFQAEYEGEFVGSTDALFPPHLLRESIAPYALMHADEARGEEVAIGIDWGRAFDRHAVVCVGVLDDYGVNEKPILFVPLLESSQRPYTDQVEAICSLVRKGQRRMTTTDFYSRPRVDRLPNAHTFHESGATVRTQEEIARATRGFTVRQIVTEMNGVGAMPSEVLRRRLGNRVVGIHSSQRSKEDTFSRLRALMSDHRLVLPNDLELLRQLQGLTIKPTPAGGFSTEADDPNVHDDLADALALATSVVPNDARGGHATHEPQGVEWTETEGSVRVPIAARPRRPGSLARTARITTW